MKSSGFKGLDLPCNSPDFNTIENIIQIMGSKLSKKSLLLWLNCRKALVGFRRDNNQSISVNNALKNLFLPCLTAVSLLLKLVGGSYKVLKYLILRAVRYTVTFFYQKFIFDNNMYVPLFHVYNKN